MSTNGLINVLPTDCLFCVFSYLSVEDRLRVHGVCKRWRDLGSFVWRDVNKIDLTKMKKLRNQYSRIVSLCENALLDLSVNVYDDSDVLTVAADCCENLRKITVVFQSFRETESQFRQLNELFKSNRKIRSVVLDDVQQNFPSDVYWLSDLPVQLEELELWGFPSCRKGTCETMVAYEPCDEFLAKFTNLRNLVLNGFKIFGDELKAIKHMKELRSLELYENHTMSDFEIDRIAKLTKLEHLFLHRSKKTTQSWCAELVENNPNLRHLKFCGNFLSFEAIQEFSKLPMLEILEIRYLYCGSSTDDDFGHFYNLKRFDCDIVKDQGVISLLENSPNLEFVNVSGSQVGDITPRVLDVAHHTTSCRADTSLHIIVDDNIVDAWRRPADVSPLLKIEKSTTYFERVKKILPSCLWGQPSAFYVSSKKNLIEMQ